MLADQVDYVVGVDPHRDSHALAIVHVLSGAIVFETTIAASSQGYAEALQLVDAHAAGRRAFAVEGSGSFGAGLTRFLTGRGEWVLEVSRLRRERRSGGKTDALDAVRAARSVLGQERPATPRAGGERQALQALVAAREGAVNAKCAGLAQIRDLLITTPEPLRSELRPLTQSPLLRRLASTRPETRPGASRQPARPTLGRSTRAAAASRGTRARTPDRGPHAQTRAAAPRPARCRAARRRPARPLLVTPRPHPIGSRLRTARRRRTDPRVLRPDDRYRLDRSGDRKLNRALHLILVTRKRTHPPTKSYIERRIQEGKTRREATRCLKRYLARSLYRLLEHPPMPA